MASELTSKAARIIEEKPDGWEYTLTAEMLRAEMAPVLQRWASLNRGLYSKPTIRVARNDSIVWMQDRLAEVERLTNALTALSNEEFARAWGAPGEPGDADLIIHTSRLWAEMCGNALQWEETVRFAGVDPLFERVRVLFVGVAGRMIDEAAKLPAFISAVVDDPEASGTHTLDMVLTLPEDWAAHVKAALDEATDDFIANPE